MGNSPSRLSRMWKIFTSVRESIISPVDHKKGCVASPNRHGKRKTKRNKTNKQKFKTLAS